MLHCIVSHLLASSGRFKVMLVMFLPLKQHALCSHTTYSTVTSKGHVCRFSVELKSPVF